jgi:hypothetical protein
MDAYMVVFRIIHIVSAILWAGAAVYFAGFVGPTFEAFRPESGKYFNYLVGRRKAVIFFLTVSTLTVVAGGFLYWRDSGGLDSDWILSGFGTSFTVGGIAGLIAWLIVLLVLAPTSYRIMGLGSRIAAAGTPPTEEQTASIRAMQGRLKRFSIIVSGLLITAAVAMAVARYLNF